MFLILRTEFSMLMFYNVAIGNDINCI